MLSDVEWSIIVLSLRVALWATLVSLPFAILAAWVLARKRFPGHTILDGLVHLPLVLPPVAVGYGLLLLFGKRGLIGAWLNDVLGLSFSFSWRGAALAAAIMGFPLMVRAIRLSIEAIDSRLEYTAKGLGASAIDAFFSITLPLSLPGICVGLILGFTRALGEFGATITFVGSIAGETRILSLAIYQNLQQPNGEASAVRLIAVAVTLSLLALLLSSHLMRRHKMLRSSP